MARPGKRRPGTGGTGLRRRFRSGRRRRAQGWRENGLAAAGFTKMAAMDISQGMLDVAQAKNVYSSFHQMVMGETLGFETDEFDAVISVGVFTLGHAPIHSFDELVRVTKPGGYIVFSLRTDMVDDGYQSYFDGLAASGQWKLAQVTDPFQPMPKGEPEVFHQVWGLPGVLAKSKPAT